MVGSGQGAFEGEVLLDHMGAERRRGDGNGDALGVVRQADPEPEGVGQGRHGGQVGVPGRRRIFGRAVEDHDLFRKCPTPGGGREGGAEGLAARRAPGVGKSESQDRQGVLDLLQGAHAGRQDDVATALAGLQQERPIGDFAGRHLQGPEAQVVDQES